MKSSQAARPLRVGLVGCGIVGGGVAEALLRKDRPWDTRRSGSLIELARVADVRWADSTVPKILRASDASEVINDPEIDVVIELVGGTTFAYGVIDRALDAGKDVVTANKALLAERGDALFAKARKTGREIAFEAAVAGGIPILDAIRGGLAANRIEKVFGILNGTTNFILTKMAETGASFEDALKTAQELGFAEADPTLDVEGIDAAHKIHLLAALALGRRIAMKNIPVQGIRRVSAMDIAYARQLGCRIKLLAAAKRIGDGIEISVAPTLVPASHPLANVNNEINAVFVEGELVGETLFVGRGAGRYPTASAVISDLIHLARRRRTGESAGTVADASYVALMTDASSSRPVHAENYHSRYYLRITAAERPGVLAAVTGILGRAGISIASVVQLEREEPDAPVPVALLTHETTAARIAKATMRIDRLAVVKAKTVVFPVV